MKPPFVRSAYNYDMDEASELSGLKCLDKSRTQQEFVEESDINYIADRYRLTGEMPQVLQLPSYGDFTGVFDFQSAQNAVRTAMEGFMALPAKIRARFDNDPQKLLGFLEDPENLDEAQRLGLVTKAVAPSKPEDGTPPASPAPDAATATKTPATPAT